MSAGYIKGYFILADGSVAIHDGGEEAIMKYAREKKLQVFWNEVSLASALLQMGKTLPPDFVP